MLEANYIFALKSIIKLEPDSLEQNNELPEIELDPQPEPRRGPAERRHGFLRVCGAGGTRPPNGGRPCQLRAAHLGARTALFRRHLRAAGNSRPAAPAA